jgi:CrcB protein
MNNIIFVFLGGGLGSLARFGVSEIVKTNFKSSFPFATLISNIASCLILAIMVGVLSNKAEENPSLKMFISHL